MSKTEISLQLKELPNSSSIDIVSIKISHEKCVVCQYMELFRYYHITADTILEDYIALDSHTTMGTLTREFETLRNKIEEDEQSFLKTSVLDEVINFNDKLWNVVQAPVKYMKELMELMGTVATSRIGCVQMNDIIIQQCKQYPKEMAVGIMSDKVSEAVRFIPNIQRWGKMFPQLDDVVKDLWMTVEFARNIIKLELEQLPIEAKNETSPLFFSWWYMDNALGLIENEITNRNK